MMGLGRERRLNCRLYVDRQSDAKVVEKLDRLLVGKHFLNQTELIKHGIELVYREVYKEGSRANSTYMSGERLQKLAEVVSGELKPELRLLLEGAEARILEKIDSVKVNSVMVGETDNVPGVVGVGEGEAGVIGAVRQSDRKIEESADTSAEKVLSGSAISFLKGLNDD